MRPALLLGALVTVVAVAIGAMGAVPDPGPGEGSDSVGHDAFLAPEEFIHSIRQAREEMLRAEEARLRAEARAEARRLRAERERRRQERRERRRERRERRDQALLARLQPFEVTLVQANIYVGLGREKFLQDLGAVSEGEPDFLTLNETHHRPDEVLVPPGYAAYRDMTDTATRETPVLWRTDTWKRVAAGTDYLSTRQVKWGIRAVNWVRLEHRRSGLQVTVFSAHPAPTRGWTAGLLPEFMAGLARLTSEAAEHGPVLVGGDLNAHWGGLYDTIEKHVLDGGLRTTAHDFGPPRGGTSDYGRKPTVDYVLYSTHGGIEPAGPHWTLELNSDHDAVGATFTVDPVHFLGDLLPERLRGTG